MIFGTFPSLVNLFLKWLIILVNVSIIGLILGIYWVIRNILRRINIIFVVRKSVLNNWADCLWVLIVKFYL